ncbi:hypothetical protein B0H13DRAFT_1860542 [Mycena leptocephala]|nr:hypothetical protein B0H13DRAFT_1860542 [Mycena leptocephala]
MSKIIQPCAFRKQNIERALAQRGGRTRNERWDERWPDGRNSLLNYGLLCEARTQIAFARNELRDKKLNHPPVNIHATKAKSGTQVRQSRGGLGLARRNVRKEEQGTADTVPILRNQMSAGASRVKAQEEAGDTCTEGRSGMSRGREEHRAATEAARSLNEAWIRGSLARDVVVTQCRRKEHEIIPGAVSDKFQKTDYCAFECQDPKAEGKDGPVMDYVRQKGCERRDNGGQTVPSKDVPMSVMDAA